MTEITEGEEYEVMFDSGGNNFMLKIILSPDFPQDKPKLKIVPLIIHSWISGDGEVTSAPGLLNVSWICLLFLSNLIISLVYSPFGFRKSSASYY